ncbi:hypothetical protein MTR_8g103300 [Medicago truncatula]|uniref:Uncharacterized protein n=1 Tax=Medicago truncatula TaxID=3880 RepID=G7L884_MEDTR|nr:hypothetical protein MTR_8g103300 [Medicago truncatula]
MATSSCKALCRLSFRLQSLVHNTNTKQPSLSLHLNLKLKPQSATVPRVSLTSRLPVELSSLESMLPFYSAVASARLVSSLSIESLGWGLVPQVIAEWKELITMLLFFTGSSSSLLNTGEWEGNTWLL